MQDNQETRIHHNMYLNRGFGQENSFPVHSSVSWKRPIQHVDFCAEENRKKYYFVNVPCCEHLGPAKKKGTFWHILSFKS